MCPDEGADVRCSVGKVDQLGVDHFGHPGNENDRECYRGKPQCRPTVTLQSL